MANTIISKPNQSMPDIIIQALGSMEAGMSFCAINNVSITDIPVVGEEYIIPEKDNRQSQTDDAALQYFRQNRITAGTLGSEPPAPLTLMIVLKPVLNALYSGPLAPAVQGFYTPVLDSTVDFIHLNALMSAYPYDNKMFYQEESDMYAGLPPATAAETGGLPMTGRHVMYNFPWVSPEKVWMWNPYSSGLSVTYEDIAGNTAVFAPVTVWMDNVPQFHEMMIASLDIEFVVSDGAIATLRLTRNHPVSVYTNIASPTGSVNMSWVLPGAILYEDPLNPADPDIMLVDMPPGTYTFGVQTEYIDHTASFTLPGKSICTQVITVS